MATTVEKLAFTGVSEYKNRLIHITTVLYHGQRKSEPSVLV